MFIYHAQRIVADFNDVELSLLFIGTIAELEHFLGKTSDFLESRRDSRISSGTVNKKDSRSETL
jgi:hypothetical protein